MLAASCIRLPPYVANLQGPGMAARNYPTAFPLKHQQKDMRLAIALGDKLGQALPTSATANELYKRVRQQLD